MQRLKQLRKENGITAKQLAEKLQVSESTISLYENGKREPDFKTLLSIANYFNVSLDYLLENEPLTNTSYDFASIKDGTIAIRSRDGSVLESELNDEQLELFKNMLKQFKGNK